MTESTANLSLSLVADEADKERERIAAWVTRNAPRASVYVRPSLFVRMLRALGF